MPTFKDDPIDITMSPEGGAFGMRVALGRTNTGIIIGGAGGQAIFCDCSQDPAPDAAPVVEVRGAGIGLRAQSGTNFGVHGRSTTNAGVFAESDLSGNGLLAKAITGNAVQADSDSGVGVAGATNSSSQSAVFGFNGAKGEVPDGLNRPAGNGVWGHTTVEKGSGVVGSVESNLSQAAGVVGIGPTAGRFFGNVEVTGDVFLTNKDLAEHFNVDSSVDCEVGMVMVLGETGSLVPCSQPYDKRVVGVVCGAGGLGPAITLGAVETSARTAAIALVGTAFCLVDADFAPVEVGDLVTSSETRGHAMKATEPMKAFCAIIGKALAPLPEGRGAVPILIALQ